MKSVKSKNSQVNKTQTLLNEKNRSDSPGSRPKLKVVIFLNFGQVKSPKLAVGYVSGPQFLSARNPETISLTLKYFRTSQSTHVKLTVEILVTCF